MNKKPYLSPAIEAYDVAVEQGFAATGDYGKNEDIIEDPTQDW